VEVRGRLAPTPSGRMHLGNARTALLAWLQVRKANGSLVLRIEDIDRARSRREYEGQIMEDLRWLGLDWDEGPDLGGSFGPYRQSERLELYESALDKLMRNGRLYPCFCSRAQLQAIASAPHGLSSEGPAYPGLCRALSEAERAERARSKRPSLRFVMPERDFRFADLAAGPQTIAAPAGGDFIVRRADGMIAYQLAVVVDDAAMGITHVLRGADLLDSTPRQLALYEALGLKAPEFAHVPLMLGPDGARLAKRHGTVSVAELRERGIAPEKLVGYLAYVSGLIDRNEPIRPEELIAGFDLAKIPRQPVTVNGSELL